MKCLFKINASLLATIRADLRRPHPFAHERVGFIGCGLAAAHDRLLILAQAYEPVMDEQYLRDPRVGAMISGDAIRQARQWAMDSRLSMFHVHTHGGRGVPGFSGVDIRENAKFVPNFVSVAPHAVHGALVLSDDAAFGQVWRGRQSPEIFITRFVEVGLPLRTWNAS